MKISKKELRENIEELQHSYNHLYHRISILEDKIEILDDLGPIHGEMVETESGGLQLKKNNF